MATRETRDFARQLRKDMTDAERKLWGAIRYGQICGVKFRRQAPIGKYVVDFVAFEYKFVVELDGGQHAERVEYDDKRTTWLQSQGFKVVRFWNCQVFEDLDAVVDEIERQLGVSDRWSNTPPTLTLPHTGGGNKTSLPHKGGGNQN